MTRALSSRVTRDPHGNHVGRTVLPCAIFTRPLQHTRATFRTRIHSNQLASQFHGIPRRREQRARFHRIFLGGIFMPAPHPLTRPPSQAHRGGADPAAPRIAGADRARGPAPIGMFSRTCVRRVRLCGMSTHPRNIWTQPLRGSRRVAECNEPVTDPTSAEPGDTKNP